MNRKAVSVLTICCMFAGAYKYREGKYMYSERQMRRRISRLYWKIRRAGGIDILVTHAPAYRINDLDTQVHRGFHCFLWILEKFKPRYFIHGHVHKNYGISIPRRSEYEKTAVFNACGYVVIDYDCDRVEVKTFQRARQWEILSPPGFLIP